MTLCRNNIQKIYAAVTEAGGGVGAEGGQVHPQFNTPAPHPHSHPTQFPIPHPPSSSSVQKSENMESIIHLKRDITCLEISCDGARACVCFSRMQPNGVTPPHRQRGGAFRSGAPLISGCLNCLPAVNHKEQQDNAALEKIRQPILNRFRAIDKQ